MEGLDRHFLPRRGHRRSGTARCHSGKRIFNVKDCARPYSATALRRLRIGHDRRCGQDARAPGKPARRPRRVYDLLRALSLDAGRVVTYETLMRRVWGGRKGADEKSVRAYVQRLRAKLGDDAKRPTYIVTELRVGYRMSGPGEA